MFGGEGYDGGWPWWLERVLAADGDRNTFYLVLDLMAITASSPMAANTVSSISSPLSNLDFISLARLGSSGTLISSRMSPFSKRRLRKPSSEILHNW